MTRSTTGPNLFIPGAPKCGTSWAAGMLALHPDVFVPHVKEPHLYGSDLTPLRWSRTASAVQDLYGDADGAPALDASVFYLTSQRAAAEIKAACPEARILIMVRHPLRAIESLHAQLVFDRNEDIVDLNEAVRACSDRSEGRRIPRTCTRPEALDYVSVVRFGAQAQRFVREFGEQQVRFVFHQDLVDNRKATQTEILRFFGLDPHKGSEPSTANARREVRSKAVSTVLRSVERSERAKQAVRKALPHRTLWRLRTQLKKLNSRPADHLTLEPTLGAEILDSLSTDIDLLEKLAGRRLDSWRCA